MKSVLLRFQLYFLFLILFPVRIFALNDTISTFPFTEDWSSGSFETNHWTFPYGQGNWAISQNDGNPAPCAVFTGQPQQSNYINALESAYFDARDLTCDDLELDFDLKLAVIDNSGSEKIRVVLVVDTIEYDQRTFYNVSGFNWEHKHLQLIYGSGNVFKIKFVAYGLNSSSINAWQLDNIKITRSCRKPLDLSGTANPSSGSCIIHLTWSPPDCERYPGNLAEFIFDDGSWEMAWGVAPGYTLWLGNEFPIAPTLGGFLKSFDVYFVSNASCPPNTLQIDVFDASRSLIGSTEPFVAVNDQWTTVITPDIPFSGPFYAMVLWDNELTCSSWLAEDTDGPYSTDDLAWSYYNSEWAHLEGDPGVFLIRAKAYITNEHKSAGFTIDETCSGEKVFYPDILTRLDSSGDAGMNRKTGSNKSSVTDTSVLLGYNLYRETSGVRDSVKLNGNLITDTSYTDLANQNLAYYYSVTAVYSDQCESEEEFHMDYLGCPLSVNDGFSQSKIRIAPNPANDFLEISSEYNIRSIRMCDSQGRYQSVVADFHGNTFRADVSNLSEGLYFITIITDFGTSSGKVLISR